MIFISQKMPQKNHQIKPSENSIEGKPDKTRQNLIKSGKSGHNLEKRAKSGKSEGKEENRQKGRRAEVWEMAFC